MSEAEFIVCKFTFLLFAFLLVAEVWVTIFFKIFTFAVGIFERSELEYGAFSFGRKK